eukprot:TRINITY_DN5483_c0_g1_i1.p1 TRINITY_DN5483_c0_g1~~TRINITY_DN5483_c0_g1_i1.p1  ORF type:complete len:662 (-),score=186.84 TRINITY_DN5483_c0_g1_i1:29-2014(-)
MEWKSQEKQRKTAPSLLSICVQFICAKMREKRGNLLRFSEIELTNDSRNLLFLNEFSLGSVDNCTLENVLENDLVQLNLNECVGIDDQSIEFIVKKCGNTLKTLSLNDCSGITDIGLKDLCIPSLTKLDLNGCNRMGSQGMKSLVQNCPNLNELDLSECYFIDDDAIYHLLQSKSLIILTLADCFRVKFTFEDVQNFEREKVEKSPLKSLCMRHTFITDESVRMITQICSDLRILDLSWCNKLTDLSSIYIAEKKYSNLFALNVWGWNKLTDVGVQNFCKSLPKLSSLTISECNGITDQSIISIIAMSPLVSSLNLWGCTSLSPASIQLLLRHTSAIQSLGLSFCHQINDSALQGLATKLPSLKSLQFESCRNLTDETLKTLGSTTIQSINLRRCTSITSFGVWECVQRCTSLTNLNLAFVSLDVETLENLSKLPIMNQLKLLDLSGQKNLCDLRLAQFFENESLCETLNVFKMDESLNVTNEGFSHLLQSCEALTTISLCFCTQLSDDAFQSLGRENHSQITSVSIGGCGGFTNKTISKISSSCPKLKEFVLAWNKKITDDEISKLAQSCPNLKTVNLSYCDLVTDAGIKELLLQCKNLKKLDAGFCPLIEAPKLLGPSEKCSSLQSVRLACKLTGAEQHHFETEIKKNCPFVVVETTSS